MRPIPIKLREKMNLDPWYHRCCLTGSAFGKIEWHHNFIFAGRQVNEEWCILPVSEAVHKEINSPYIRKLLNWVMLNRADEQTLKKYSVSRNLIRERVMLNLMFGEFNKK